MLRRMLSTVNFLVALIHNFCVIEAVWSNFFLALAEQPQKLGKLLDLVGVVDGELVLCGVVRSTNADKFSVLKEIDEAMADWHVVDALLASAFGFPVGRFSYLAEPLDRSLRQLDIFFPDLHVAVPSLPGRLATNPSRLNSTLESILITSSLLSRVHQRSVISSP